MVTENLNENFKTEAKEVPITTAHSVARVETEIKNPGQARFNQAADKYHPNGTGWNFTKSKGEAFSPKH
jgi:hypothetical protein